jgi:hypothetical protein
MIAAAQLIQAGRHKLSDNAMLVHGTPDFGQRLA